MKVFTGKDRKDRLQNNILEEKGAQNKSFSVQEKMKEQLEAARLEPSIKEVILTKVAPQEA